MQERVKEGRRKTYADTKISQMVSALTDSKAEPEVKQAASLFKSTSLLRPGSETKAAVGADEQQTVHVSWTPHALIKTSVSRSETCAHAKNAQVAQGGKQITDLLHQVRQTTKSEKKNPKISFR